jgi:hypothetical protein
MARTIGCVPLAATVQWNAAMHISPLRFSLFSAGLRYNSYGLKTRRQMANKKLAEPRLYEAVEKLLRERIDNVEILDRVRKLFPIHRPSLQQITSHRHELRRRKEGNVPISLEARQRRKNQSK